MKAKTIQNILANKFKAWTRSIKDEEVKKLVEGNSIITGGSIVSMLLNEEVSDYDVYFRNAETAFKVAQYYAKQMQENPLPSFQHGAKIDITALLEPAIGPGEIKQRICGSVEGPQPARVRIVVKSVGVASENQQNDYQYFEGISDPTEQANAVESYIEAATQLDDITNKELKDSSQKNDDKIPYRAIFVTSNAITLDRDIQLILRFQGEPEQIHENYDFVHCTNYWTSWENKLTLRKEALECILTKELHYIGSKYPICSIIRTRKFITRGWTINAGQFVKMAWQVSQLDMSSIQVLEDQLVGVDSAYFSQVIEILKKDRKEMFEKNKDNPHFEIPPIEGTYLITLIDKIFN